MSYCSRSILDVRVVANTQSSMIKIDCSINFVTGRVRNFRLPNSNSLQDDAMFRLMKLDFSRDAQSTSSVGPLPRPQIHISTNSPV